MARSDVHFEVPYDDVDRATSFYQDVFGWQIQGIPEMNYHIVSTGPSGDQGPTEPGYIGGRMFARQANIATPIITIDVDDIDATLATIESRGGSSGGEEDAGRRHGLRGLLHRL